MGASVFVRILLVPALLIAIPGVGYTQPLAWSVQQHPVSQIGPYVTRLQVRNLATGVVEASFDIPDRIEAGHGVLSPDSRYYLLPTNIGIARFVTSPPALDTILGAGVAVRELFIEPVGARLHAVGDFGHAVLDWDTGALLSLECCAQQRILFTPDGSKSITIEPRGSRSAPTETVVNVFAEPVHTLQWSITVSGRIDSPVVSDSNLALVSSGLGQVLIWRLADGAEQGRLGTSGGLVWRADTLLVSGFRRLSAFDLPDLNERVLAERVSGPSSAGGLGVYVSSDGGYAVWLRHWSLLGVSVSGTVYHVVDVDAGTIVTEGGFGPRMQADLTLEPAAFCLFAVPTTVTAPAEGGNVAIPVIPGPTCRSWTAPAALNPGPHPGAATLLIPVAPNPGPSLRELSSQVGGQTTLIQQGSATPGPPEARLELTGNRATLTWSPTFGAGITSWVLRGAVQGGTIADLVTKDASVRTWTSPALPPGSYTAEVVAVNAAGRSPGAALSFSVGVSDRPAAPIGLSATVIDDSVSLTWDPSPAGPAPSSYLIEAGAATGSAYFPVATTQMPSLTVARAPHGAWHVRVRALTAGGVSDASAPISVLTTACTAAPSAPQHLWSLSSWPDTTLRWGAPASGSVHEYILEVGSKLGLADVGRVTVAGGSRGYSAPTPTSGTRVFVQVRARNACGESVPSNPVVVPAY